MYKADNDICPQDLEDLSPDYLDELPSVASDADYLYEVSADGITCTFSAK